MRNPAIAETANKTNAPHEINLLRAAGDMRLATPACDLEVFAMFTQDMSTQPRLKYRLDTYWTSRHVLDKVLLHFV